MPFMVTGRTLTGVSKGRLQKFSYYDEWVRLFKMHGIGKACGDITMSHYMKLIEKRESVGYDKKYDQDEAGMSWVMHKRYGWLNSSSMEEGSLKSCS